MHRGGIAVFSFGKCEGAMSSVRPPFFRVSTLGRRAVLAGLGAAIAAAAVPLAGPAAAQGTVNVLNWQGYGTDERFALEAFKAKTGLEVVHDYFNSEQEMLTKLRTNPGAYDVVLINGAFTEQAA